MHRPRARSLSDFGLFLHKTNCGSRMSVIALILDPDEIRTISACMARHDQGPPTEG